MSTTSQSAVPHSGNNLDALRLAFATMVVFAHAFTLAGMGPLLEIAHVFRSDIAVEGFFIISGLLVFRSYASSSTIKSYVEKRARRIVPAYVLVVFISVLLGIVFSEIPLKEFFGAKLWKYIFANLAFLNFVAPSMPGVFDSQNMSDVNPALWSLKVELMFYALVPLIFILTERFNKIAILIAMYLVGYVYGNGFKWIESEFSNPLAARLAQQLPAFLGYFAVGIGAHYCLEYVKKYCVFLLGGGLVLLLLASGRYDFLTPIALGGAVLGAAFLPFSINVTKFGDISYGMYIYHCLVIHSLVELGLYRHSFFLGLILTIIVTVFASYLSWWGLERRFLSRRPAVHNLKMVEN